MHKACVTLAAMLTAALLSAALARAQSAPADAMAAAKELMVTMRTADQFRAILPVVVRGLKPAIVQNRPQVEQDFDAIVPILVDGMAARVDGFIDQITALYARLFTVAELRELTAFYRGPTGQRFLQQQTTITQESMAMGQKFGQAVAAELQGKIVEELRKRGHKL